MKKSAIATLKRHKKQRLHKAAGRKKSSTSWLKRQLNDPYVLETKRLQWRSRAAFKLLHIQNKYALMQPGHSVVDLGCAPGGWLQIARRYVGDGGFVIGVDKRDVPPISGTVIVKGDLAQVPMQQRIISLLPLGVADGVFSDMAANATGHKRTDHLQVVALAEMAVSFATTVLKPRGYLVIKVFAGGAEQTLLECLKRQFTKIEHYKPPSSRKNSREIYVIALDFKGNVRSNGENSHPCR